MKKKVFQNTPKYGICIDWETSGAVWGGDSSKEYQGLSFGAVIFDAKTFEPVKTLYREIKFNAEKYKWSSEAAAIHGMTQEYLEEHGVAQEEAAMDLLELLAEFFAGSKPMMMGHNKEFDRRFTNQLLNTVDVEFVVEPTGNYETVVQLHHVGLDTAAIGFVALGLFKSDLLFEAVGLEERGEHNALTDALMTLETCRCVRLLVDTALNG